MSTKGTLYLIKETYHHIALVLSHPLHDTVVRVDALVQALKSLNAVVFDYLQGQFEAPSHLFQLSEDAIRDVRDN